jgi:hypothetical protein
MTDDGTATAAKPRRAVTLREMRERASIEAYRYRSHQDMMRRLVADYGHPYAENPEEYLIADAFEAVVGVLDWLKSDDVAFERFKAAARARAAAEASEVTDGESGESE